MINNENKNKNRLLKKIEFDHSNEIFKRKFSIAVIRAIKELKSFQKYKEEILLC